MKILQRLAVFFLISMMGLSFISSAQVRQGNKQSSQEQKDSLVVLLSSKSAHTIELDGVNYRKIVGPARFLHNGTYLICDTALWNVESKTIDAWGHVSILQEETKLTSDNLKYLIDEDLAQFRGSVVQLTDKDRNTLRTRHLDYNTADSVAVFMNGASLKDKDGQIIESRSGSYDSKKKIFTFSDNVNMFTDSIFVKTNHLTYESDLDLATFSSPTDVWKDENMLSSHKGWYDRSQEVFFFTGNVHVMSEDQEGWCDSLFFYRNTSDVNMLGNAQVTDTTRNVFGLAGRIEYIDSLSKVTMTRKPAVISETEESDGTLDTLYLGAEKLVYYTVQKCNVDSLVAVEADKRLEILSIDPIKAFRKKAAEEAAKAAEEASKNDPNRRPSIPAGGAASQIQGNAQIQGDAQIRGKAPEAGRPVVDSLAVADTTSVVDSLAVADTVIVLPPKDTTDIGFLEAVRNVRIYKKNLQVTCDSLLYSDLDSLARLYKQPLIWQEVTQQYSADSVFLVIRDGGLHKANLMSNAFIAIEQDTVHYNQIKGAEMLAHFDKNGELYRFDALGGAAAVFYIEENDELATVNKPESKILSATLKDGEVQRVYYFTEAKNDGFPLLELSLEEQRLKGFNWTPDKRPADRTDVTPLSLRPSERRRYAAKPRAKYTETDRYFPGYMKGVYRQIAERDSLKRVRDRERRLAEMDAEQRAREDSLFRVDSLARVDSLNKAGRLAALDSLRKEKQTSPDSLMTSSDSLHKTDSVQKEMSPEDLKAARKEAREKAKAERKAARKARKAAKLEAQEKKWAELDKRDAEKAAEKEAKRKIKERMRKRQALQDALDQTRKDAEMFERYRQQYEAQKAAEEAKENGVSSE